MDEVAHARSTWRKAKEFQGGLRELATRLPLSVARAYIVAGTRLDAYDAALYARVDELQALRKSGIQGEMHYVEAQVIANSKRDPVKAAQAARSLGHPDDAVEGLVAKVVSFENDDGNGDRSAVVAEFLGGDVMSGDDIRFGFGPDVLEVAPSLSMYELFMWFDENELEAAR